MTQDAAISVQPGAGHRLRLHLRLVDRPVQLLYLRFVTRPCLRRRAACTETLRLRILNAAGNDTDGGGGGGQAVGGGGPARCRQWERLGRQREVQAGRRRRRPGACDQLRALGWPGHSGNKETTNPCPLHLHESLLTSLWRRQRRGGRTCGLSRRLRSRSLRAIGGGLLARVASADCTRYDGTTPRSRAEAKGVEGRHMWPHRGIAFHRVGGLAVWERWRSSSLERRQTHLLSRMEKLPCCLFSRLFDVFDAPRAVPPAGCGRRAAGRPARPDPELKVRLHQPMQNNELIELEKR